LNSFAGFPTRVSVRPRRRASSADRRLAGTLVGIYQAHLLRQISSVALRNGQPGKDCLKRTERNVVARESALCWSRSLRRRMCLTPCAFPRSACIDCPGINNCITPSSWVAPLALTGAFTAPWRRMTIRPFAFASVYSCPNRTFSRRAAAE